MAARGRSRLAGGELKDERLTDAGVAQIKADGVCSVLKYKESYQKEAFALNK